MAQVNHSLPITSINIAAVAATMIDMTTSGERIREERLARGLSQRALGKSAQVTKQAVSRIEIGHTKEPEAKTLEPICRALKLNLRWVLDGSGPKYLQASTTTTIDASDQSAAIEELRIALALTAQALAESIPAAGRELERALAGLPGDLRDRIFLQGLRDTLQGELASHQSERAPKPRARASGGRKRP